jgi:hypothetical protein
MEQEWFDAQKHVKNAFFAGFGMLFAHMFVYFRHK